MSSESFESDDSTDSKQLTLEFDPDDDDDSPPPMSGAVMVGGDDGDDGPETPMAPTAEPNHVVAPKNQPVA